MSGAPLGPGGVRAARASNLAVLLVVAVAAALRLWGTCYGLPHVYHSDEAAEVRRALMLGAGVFDLGRAFKGALYYLLFVEYGLYYLLLKALGSVRSTFDFLVLYFSDPTGFWRIGRTTVALIGAANVYLVYRLGARLRDRATGLLAALFLTCAADHAWSSHFITVDVLMTSLLALAALQAVAIARRGARRDYLRAGLFAALAVMAKLPAVLILIAVAVSHAARLRAERGRARDFLLDRRALLAALVFVAVTVAGNPGFLPGLVQLAREQLTDRPLAAWEFVAADPYLARTGSTWVFYLGSMLASLGPAVMVLGVLGLGAALLRPRPEPLGLALFALASYAVICMPITDDWVYPRYALPVQLALVVLAAQFLSGLRERLPRPLPRPVAWALVLALVAPPLVAVVRQDLLFTRADTRTLALAWVEENVPPGSRIVLEGRGTGASISTVPLANRPQNVLALLALYQSARRAPGPGPPGLRDEYHRAELAALAGRRTYDLMLTASELLPYRPLADYLDAGAQWVVIDPDHLAHFREGVNAERFPEVAAFYRDVEASPRLELARRFVPEGRLGPTLEIHRVR